MPTYPHICHACNFEWEEIYGMTADPPTICPNCKKEGQVERLIAGGCGEAIITLTGYELNEKLKKDAADFKKQAYKDEKLMANLVGEEKYHRNEIQRDQIKRDFSGMFRRVK